MRSAAALVILLASTINAAAEMSVSFEWGPTKKCDTKSPPISVRDAPEGTVKLQISMTDINVPDYRHGGGTVAYATSVPYGAFRYKGPCPPSGKHKYRFTVKALDANKKTLATATASRSFPE